MKAYHYSLVALCSVAVFFTSACGGGESQNGAVNSQALPEDPAAAIEMIAGELADGKAEILWQAMPSSYQSDLNEIARLAGAKVDAEIYDKSFRLLSKLVQVADKQKDFILNSSLAGPQPAEQIAEVEAAWPSVIGFFNTLLSSPIASVEGLQAFDGERFFGTTVSELLQHVDGMAALNEDMMPIASFKGVSAKVLSQTGDIAMLEVTSPDGEIESQEFIQVEGRWVPTEMATDWATNMANAKAQLEAITPEETAQNKPQILMILQMMDGILTQLDGAQSQQEFDQAVQGAMMPLMGLMMMAQ